MWRSFQANSPRGEFSRKAKPTVSRMPTQGQPKPQITRRPKKKTSASTRKKVNVPGVCKEGNTGCDQR
jgi:hypothetical protein